MFLGMGWVKGLERERERERSGRRVLQLLQGKLYQPCEVEVDLWTRGFSIPKFINSAHVKLMALAVLIVASFS